MDVSIIIVNWNSADFTIACIRSIQVSGLQATHEIIVVDNNSQEDCSHLTCHFPSVVLIRSDKNIGFARANNMGADVARGRTLLFLNPDTQVLGNAIQTMAESIAQDQCVGAAGCRLLNTDLTLQTSCVQRFPTIINQIFGIGWFQRIAPAAHLSSLFAGLPQHPRPEVEVVSGACLMVKRNVFDAVGKFSTDYFLYGEEADLCYKIRRAGWKVRYVPDAEVLHHGGGSSKKIAHASTHVLMRDSVFKLLRKYRGGAYAHTYRLALGASAIIRLLILWPVLLIPTRVVNCDRAMYALAKWTRIARWSLSLNPRILP